MPLSSTERAQAFRQRKADLLASARAEVASLRQRLAVAEAERDSAVAEAERLAAELASGPVPRCRHCRGELACPACYRAGDDF